MQILLVFFCTSLLMLLISAAIISCAYSLDQCSWPREKKTGVCRSGSMKTASILIRIITFNWQNLELAYQKKLWNKVFGWRLQFIICYILLVTIIIFKCQTSRYHFPHFNLYWLTKRLCHSFKAAKLSRKTKDAGFHSKKKKNR